jgi:hypothetical protein
MEWTRPNRTTLVIFWQIVFCKDIIANGDYAWTDGEIYYYKV